MRTFLGVVVIGFVCLAGVAMAQGQASQPAPVMTDEVFKSVQVLKGIPVDTFFEAMGMFASSMGNDCTFCHVKEAYLRSREVRRVDAEDRPRTRHDPDDERDQ